MKHCLVLTVIVSSLLSNCMIARMIQLEKKDRILDVVSYEIGDFDGDGIPEIAYLSNNRKGILIRVFSKKNWMGRSIRDIRPSGADIYLTKIMKIDMTDDPGEELAIFYKDIKGDSIWVAIHSFYMDKVVCRTEVIRGENRSEKDSHIYPSWDGVVDVCRAYDIDGDGVKEILLSTSVGFDCYPRGVFVYKYPSGKLLWKFLTAGEPQFLTFGDANGDSKAEIYFKTWAPGNGCTVGEFVDRVSRMWAINYDGSLLWQTPQKDAFGSGSSNLQVCDCDRDGIVEAYYTTLENAYDLDSVSCKLNKVRAWDNEPIDSLRFDIGTVVSGIMMGDLNRDGNTELIVNEFPTSINSATMTPERKGNAFRFAPKLIVDDLDMDSDSMLGVVTYKSDTIVIFNHEMKRVCTYSFGGGEKIRQISHFIDPFGRSCFAVIADFEKDGLKNTDLFILNATSISNLSYLFIVIKHGLGRWYIGLIGLFLGALLGALAAIKHAKYKSRKSDCKLNEPDYRPLLSYLTTFNHGQMAGKNLNRLSLLFGNLPDDEQKIVELRDRIDSALKGYRTFASEQLTAIIAESENHERVLRTAKSLELHKNELDDLLPKSADRVSHINGNHLRASIPDAVKQLKNDINELYQTVRTSFRTDLLHVLRKTLQGLSRRFDQEGIVIDDISVTGDFSRNVFFSESELTAIIEELINNACVAMSASPEKMISIEVRYNDDSVTLKIADSGSGIDEKASAKIFDRDYTTKSDGGGYGLFHAYQQTQVFSGQIRLYNNDNGGATVEMRLRLS